MSLNTYFLEMSALFILNNAFKTLKRMFCILKDEDIFDAKKNRPFS
jgi:hypothetical protein